MDPFSIVIYVSVLFFLIYLSGRFSGAETALTSLNEIDLLQMKHKRTKNVIFIEKLMDDMDRTIITILIGNNLVNIVASSLATLLFYSLWGNIGVSISVGALTFLLLVFGEITPKAYAIKKNRRISSRNAKEIYYLSRGLAPLISMLKVISRGLMSLGRGSIAKEDFHVQELSIKHLADKGADAGEIKDIEKDIIYRVFKFGDLKVKDAMIPGNDVKYLDKKLSAIEAKKQMLYRGYTRLPVVNSQKMKIVGVINSKDLLNRMEESIKKFMRKPFIVSPDEDITSVFNTMRANRFHMAIVGDDNHKFLGIITLEDILEELVGEIYDEFDQDEMEEVTYLLTDEQKDKENGPIKKEITKAQVKERVENKRVEANPSEEIGLDVSTVIEENVEKQDIAELRLTGEAEHSMETVIKRFIDELEVDDDTAMRLYLGGYWSMEELMDAIPDDLRLVEGITPTMARTLDSKLKRYK
jgi:CBS domain containing-hemolysin-like protein